VSYRLLDLFCGAGGAAVGYHRAGFEVVMGVDVVDQPHYPFWQHRSDAIRYMESVLYDPWPHCDYRTHYDAIHASPPCQAFTAYRRKGHGIGDGYADLIAKTRDLLEATGLPYVIENVPGAPLKDPVRLCGSSFGLDVRRHRLFETNWPLMVPPCDHSWQTPRFPAATNRAENSRRTVEVGVWRIPLEEQKRAMGVDWDVTLEELSQMIPPAYTEHIGHYLIAHLDAQKAEAA
jgi:DNA (cytosine-5)-methyltransferase 1